MSGSVAFTATDQQMRMTGRWVDCIINRCPEPNLSDLASEIGHLIEVLGSLVRRGRGIGDETGHDEEPCSGEHDVDWQLAALAANIVHQIGDVLHEALPPDVAHNYFVDARRATNDRSISFTKQLISAHTERR